MAHTPGPWTAGRPDMGTVVDGIVSKWIYAGEQYVAIASGRIDGDWDEVIANARLIAAAPELLALAKRARGILGHLHGLDIANPDCVWEADYSEEIAKLDKAIAKAEGRDGR